MLVWEGFSRENIFMLSWLIETQPFGRTFKAPMTKALGTAVSDTWWAFVWYWRQDVISSHQPHWHTRTGEVMDLLSHLYCQSLNRDVGSSAPFLTMWSGNPASQGISRKHRFEHRLLRRATSVNPAHPPGHASKIVSTDAETENTLRQDTPGGFAPSVHSLCACLLCLMPHEK